jgi:hypothetical protein
MTELNIPIATLALVHAAASRAALDMLRDLGISLTPDDEITIKNTLISPIRAAMIRDEYKNAHLSGVKSEALQVELATKYNLSFDTVHSIIITRR